jgi:hypothetical protein
MKKGWMPFRRLISFILDCEEAWSLLSKSSYMP